MKIFSFLFFSIASFIISLILLLVQGIVNYHFFRFNNRKIIAERTLFEQFSYEVYSSISKPLPNYITSADSCEEPKKAVEINLNVNSYFDCRGLYSENLKPSCRNKIVNNYTNCDQDDPNDYFIFNLEGFRKDPREKCPYFSKYSQKLVKLNNYICQTNYNQMTYEELLKLSEDNTHQCQNGFNSYGILDTMNNILYLPFYLNYNNIYINSNSFGVSLDKNSHISISMVISENPPMNHEWDIMIKETFEKNLKEDEIYKRRNVSIADFNFIDSYYDYTYTNDGGGTIQLSQIQSEILGYNGNKYNNRQVLSFYRRSYIGFKNTKELKKFKKIFNENDPRDNPLYKLSSSGHNPLIEIIISCAFLVIIFAYALILRLEKLKNINDLLSYIFIGITIIFLIAGLIIIVVHFIKYTPIYIDMDRRMQKVLKAYNKRTVLSQLFRLISLVFNILSLVLILIIKIKEIRQARRINYQVEINNN